MNIIPKSLIRLSAILACLLLLTGHISAQPSRFSRELFINDKGDSLRYRMLSPDYNTSRKFPLVIFLHGSGERGNDNEAQLKWGVMNFAGDHTMANYPAYVVAPQCPENQEWANYKEDTVTWNLQILPEPSRPMALLRELISQLVQKHAIDQNRIYITGLSMGGYGTFDALMRYPQLFAAAVPVCGAGDLSGAVAIKEIPIWIFHGSEDPGVPVSQAVNMTSALFNAGGHPGCTIYPATGHFAWLAAYLDPMMMEWMFRQRK